MLVNILLLLFTKMYFILNLFYILSINILILVFFHYNYTVHCHEQRCCWNGAVKKNIYIIYGKGYEAGKSSWKLQGRCV